ncbi:MAG TPA: hypothetical protein VGN97_15035 [Mesorhizobium sp.]|jgi:acetyl-CoA carboxylase biotin carboxyl carrier protein|nr:hypothetical protein [Mesorhizobium sp.]
MPEPSLSIERIEALVDAARGRGLALLELEEEGVRLRIRFERAGEAEPAIPLAHPASPSPGTPPLAAGARPAAVVPELVRSLGVGRFLREHPLGASPLPEPGASVEKGALLGFVLSAGVLLPVHAPRAGRLGPALVTDGAAVAFGAPLFALD